jgi:hypothetical protein
MFLRPLTNDRKFTCSEFVTYSQDHTNGPLPEPVPSTSNATFYGLQIDLCPVLPQFYIIVMQNNSMTDPI